MRQHVVLAVAALLSASCFTAAYAADVYWDIDGAGAGSLTGDYNGNGVVDAADYALWRKMPGSFGGAGGYTTWRSNFGNVGGGAGGATPNGSWDSTTPNWSTSPAGNVATQVWNPAGTNVAVFSAGSDATGAYTVTIDSQTASGLRLEDGDVTLSSGTLALKTGSSINVLPGRTMTVLDTTLTNNSGETISKDGAGTLVLNGANTLAGSFNLNTGTVGIGNGQSFGGTSNTPGTSTLNINGGSLSNTFVPTATNGVVNVVNSLKVNINADFSVDPSPQGNHLISFNQTNVGGGAQILTGNRTITVNGPGSTGGGGLELAGLAFANLQDGGNNYGITKQGTGSLRFETANLPPTTPGGNPLASNFTGDVTVQQGTLELGATGWIGGKVSTNTTTNQTLGGNTIKLAGGNFNFTSTRNGSNPINNPIVLTTDAKITQTINAATLYGTLSETFFGQLSSPTNKTITFENLNPAVPAGTNTSTNDSCPVGGGACQIFYARFAGSTSYSYNGNIEIKNNATVANQLTRLSNFNTSPSTITYNGVISGNGQFTRSATSGGTGGTTVLTGANTTTGFFAVTDGTLYVNNTSGSGTGTGAVEVGSIDDQSFWNNSTSTLGGTGSMAGSVRVWRSGFLKPGTSASPIATLSGGSLTFSDANNGHIAGEPGLTLPATYGWDLNSTLGTADLMNVNGNLSFGVSDPTFGINPGGAFAALVPNDLAPTARTNGTKFTLISYSGTWDGNTFNGLPDNTGVVTIGPNQFHIDYNDTTPVLNGGSLGKYVTLTRFAPGSGSLVGGTVPEPTSAMLVLVGLVPLFWRRSR